MFRPAHSGSPLQCRTMTRPHVLVLNHFARPRDTSGGTRHVDLFGRLHGWDATILASNRSYLSQHREQATPGILRYVWTTPAAGEGIRRILHWLSYVLPAVAAGLRGPRPAIVYASTPHLFAPVAGWLLAWRYRAPLVVEIRDLWPQVLVDMGRLRQGSALHRLLTAVEEWAYRRATAIVVLAEGVADELGRRGVPRDRVHFLPNGAEPEDFVPSADRETLRARYEMDGTVFVYTGAHGLANGLDLLLDAAKELADDCSDVQVLLVGDGTDKPRLRARAANDGLHAVRFHDPIPKAEMANLLAAADCGVHVLADIPLFRYGVSPNKVVDYMAAGRPVITNTPGEVTDLVLQAGAGVSVLPTGLAEGIRKVASASDDERHAWGQAGRLHLSAHRSPSVLARRLERLLDDITDEPTSS